MARGPKPEARSITCQINLRVCPAVAAEGATQDPTSISHFPACVLTKKSAAAAVAAASAVLHMQKAGAEACRRRIYLA